MVVAARARHQEDTSFLMSWVTRWLVVPFGLAKVVTMRLKLGHVRHWWRV